MSPFIDVASGVVAACVVAAALLASGDRIRVSLRWPCRPSLRPVVAWCLGSWAVGVAVLLLGLAGVLWASTIFGVLVLAAAVGRWKELPRLLRPLRIPLLVAVPLLPFALAPPFFYDAWVYHLGLPWQALADGAFPAHADNLFATFPPLAQLLYAVPLSLGCLRAPGLLHLIGFCVAAATCTALTRRLGGGRVVSHLAGACLPYLSIAPLVAAFPAAEAWTLCGVLGALTVAVTDRGGPVFGARAGWLAGVATACRLQGLPWAAVTVAAVTLRGRRPAAGLAFVGAALIGALPWWAKNTLLLARPLAPIGQHSEGIDSLWRDAASNLNLSSGAFEAVQRAGAALPHVWIPLLPLVAGCLLVLFSARGRARCAIVTSGCAGVVLWSLTGALSRFLLPSAALLIAAALSGKKKYGHVAVALVLVGAALPGGVATISLAIRIGLFPAAESPTEFYRAVLVSNPYPGFRACARLPEDARVLMVAEPRGFLFPRPFDTTSQHDRPFLADLLDRGAAPEEIAKSLRDRGYTHVLFNVQEMRRLGERYPVLPWRDLEGRTRFVEWTRSLEPAALIEEPIVVYRLDAAHDGSR